MMRQRATLRSLPSVLLAALLSAAPLAAQPASSGQAARRTPVVAVAEKVSPAVVNVSAEAVVREADPLFGMFSMSSMKPIVVCP